ncbi:PucR family transcriptional regulator ligand-binding domain-containing protein, partial [Staphylococcus aureus]
EYGRYIQSIPTTILQKAKKHQFPIVVFHEEVSFSDITQEVHRQIISHQYQLIERLEAYTHTLSKASLTSNRPEALLEVLVEAIGG